MTIAPEWGEVKAIFQAALERPPAERSAYVRAACGASERLRAEVESLLRAHEAAASFAEASAAVDLTMPAFQSGDHVGPYIVASDR